MLGRSTLSAALAALAVPVVLWSVPAHATDGDPGDPTTSLRPKATAAPERAGQTSRQAKRKAKLRAAADDAPLAVTIDNLAPSTIPERGPIRISGRVTNNDTVTRTTINVYAFISAEPMTTPAELEQAAATDPSELVGDRITDEQHKDNIAELAPGETRSFSFTVSRKLLGVSAPGVYWFGVHALSDSTDGTPRDALTDGRARTFLPLVLPRLTGDLETAIVIPVRRQVVYSDDGSLDDLAGWTRTLSGDGRLRSLVDFGASSGSRPVTWVIDPALVDAVRRLAAGNPPRSLAANLQQGQEDDEPDSTASPDPSGTPSTPAPTETPTAEAEPADDSVSPLDLDELDPVVQAAAQAAQGWLDRLGAAMSPDDQVLTLPYGDLDVPAAADHDPALLERALARSAAGLSGYAVQTAPAVTSPSGFLSAAGLAATPDGTTVLLSDQMFRPGQRDLTAETEDGTEETPPPAAAVVDGHRVVVTSSGAAEGGPGPDDRMSIAAMRQRLLAEAAVRFLDPTAAPLTVVLPHDWNPTSGGSTFFGGLDPAWLNLSTVRAASATASASPTDGATLRYPEWQAETELEQSNFTAADGLIRSGAALQSLLSLNNLVGSTVADEAMGSASYSARTRPIANKLAADRSRQWIEERLGQVTVGAPQVVTLSSSSGHFNATLTNRLDQPVTVALDAQSDAELTISGPRRIEIPARSRRTVLLTAGTDANGVHQVRLMVTDKRGVPLGATTALSIRSAQVSNVIWLILAVGAALLFGAIGARLFRRIRDARRTPPPAEPPPAAESVPEPAGAGHR